MSEYEFTLNFKLREADKDPVEYVEALGEAGCTDAEVGLGHSGHLALEFTREAESAEDAVFSAINDVSGAIEGVILLEAFPDIVGLTDAAELLSFSRQYMRQLKDKNTETFPEPLHTGSSSLYYFSDILDFIAAVTNREVDEPVLKVARLNRRLNLCRHMAILMKQEGVKEECIELAIPSDIQEILGNAPQLVG